MRTLKKCLMVFVGIALLLAVIVFDHSIHGGDVRKSQWKVMLQWIGIFALFGAVLGLLGCVKYQPYVSVYPVSFPPDKAEWVAMTDCEVGGQPIILLNSNMVTSRVMWNYILIHEKQHAFDMRAYGCRKAMDRVQGDPDFLMALEIKAYCSQWVAMNNDGMFPEPAWQFRVMFEEVWRKYGQHLTKEMFFNRVPCTSRVPP